MIKLGYKKGSWAILAIMAVVALLVLLLLAFTISYMGDRTGAMTGSGVVNKNGSGTNTDGDPTKVIAATGACTTSEVKKSAPDSPDTQVSVPGWSNVKVHKNCTETMKNILDQIKNSGEKFSITCFSNRGGDSEHDWGIACDLNVTQNYCICKSAGPLRCPRAGANCGPNGFWKPGEQDKNVYGWSSGKDPLSIPINSTISSAFGSSGWSRGLWSYKNDFMHYSLSGK